MIHFGLASKRLLSAVPIFGTGANQAFAIDSAIKGNYWEAIADEFGNVPFVGDLLDFGRGVYEFARGVDEELRISSALDRLIGKVTGLNKELDQLDTLNGGRTDVRGLPKNEPELQVKKSMPSISEESRNEQKLRFDLKNWGLRF